MSEPRILQVAERAGGGEANDGDMVIFGIRLQDGQDLRLYMALEEFQVWLSDLHNYAQQAYSKKKTRDPAFDEGDSIRKVITHDIESYLIGHTQDRSELVLLFQATSKASLAVAIPAEAVPQLQADIETEAKKLPRAVKN